MPAKAITLLDIRCSDEIIFKCFESDLCSADSVTQQLLQNCVLSEQTTNTTDELQHSITHTPTACQTNQLTYYYCEKRQ